MTVTEERLPLDGGSLEKRLTDFDKELAEYGRQCIEPAELGPPLELKELAAFVVELRHRIAQVPQEPYPVLGAEGDAFIIEIASGPLREREILSNFIIEIKGDRSHSLPNLGEREDIREFMIVLPDFAHVIALVGLFERALRSRTVILHPLTSSGDFLPGWDEASELIAAWMPA